MERDAAIRLLHDLVAIPSPSREEREAVAFLVERMRAFGYDRTYVDDAGNAVGELGPAAAATVIVLLGHIDTVPGRIPVRIESRPGGDVLHGRGSVDAKGPLAAFVAAGARLGSAWAHREGVRLVVAGAVEEEAATSRGARAIAARFDGTRQPVPAACVIGEPSHWHRFTVGYKGRLLLDLAARQAMAHTAGPEASVAMTVVEIWNHVAALARDFNDGRARVFEQLSPSLRRFVTATTPEMDDTVDAQIAWRLPVGFEAERFVEQLTVAIQRVIGAPPRPIDPLAALHGAEASVHGAVTRLALRFHGWERAWHGDRHNALARSFLAGIRSVDGAARPATLVKTGTSDMNVVAPLWGCPTIAYGPGDSALDHTPHEHVAVADYLRAIEVLEATLRAFVAR